MRTCKHSKLLLTITFILALILCSAAISTTALANNQTVAGAQNDIAAPLAQSNGFAPFIQGFENNTFRGEAMITREQFIIILYRIKTARLIQMPFTYNLTLEDSSSEEDTPALEGNHTQEEIHTVEIPPSFKDVEPGRWSFYAIEWAKTAGLIEADVEGNFRPAEQLNRADMAVILVKADNLKQMAVNAFSDLDDHPDKDYILAAVQAKIFTGYPDGTFKPAGFCTRAEAVTALIRYQLGKEPSDDMWQDITLPFSDVTHSYWAYKYIALAVNGM